MIGLTTDVSDSIIGSSPPIVHFKVYDPRDRVLKVLKETSRVT